MQNNLEFEEIIRYLRNCKGFEDSRQNYLIHNDLYYLVGIRNKEDTYNKFDDLLYLLKGRRIVSSYQITTNAGKNGLKNFNTYNKHGCAVLDSNRIVYDCYKFGYHRQKLACLRQSKPFPYYRDNNKNEKAEEIGKLYENKIIYANIHSSTYWLPRGLKREEWMGKGVKESQIEEIQRENINGWSLACQVFKSNKEYWNFIDFIHNCGQEFFTYSIIKI